MTVPTVQTAPAARQDDKRFHGPNRVPTSLDELAGRIRGSGTHRLTRGPERLLRLK